MQGIPLFLRLYLALSHVMGPAYRLFLRRRLRRGQETRERLQERFGAATIARPAGRLVWFHAASVGECLSLLGVIRELLERDTTLNVLVTSNTLTSSRLMARELPARAFHQLGPIDTPRAARAFLAAWQPDLSVWVENELWPRLLFETHRRGIPLLQINARLTQRAQARIRQFPRTIAAIFGWFDRVMVQDQHSASALLAIGIAADRVSVGGTLKMDAAPPDAEPEELARMSKALTGRSVWLAASTHPGEDDCLVKAHGRVAETIGPAALMVLVPRHPDRAQALRAQLQTGGWHVAQRSVGEAITAQTQVYLADTLGEMGLWYRLCPVSFVGGSLVAVGGHNPYEPAQLGSAIIHGPNVANFAEIYADLQNNDAAILARDPETIAASVTSLLQSEDARQQQTTRAAALVQPGTDATNAVVNVIAEALGTA